MGLEKEGKMEFDKELLDLVLEDQFRKLFLTENHQFVEFKEAMEDEVIKVRYCVPLPQDPYAYLRAQNYILS